jgi:hypothetical protein
LPATWFVCNFVSSASVRPFGSDGAAFRSLHTVANTIPFAWSDWQSWCGSLLVSSVRAHCMFDKSFPSLNRFHGMCSIYRPERTTGRPVTPAPCMSTAIRADAYESTDTSGQFPRTVDRPVLFGRCTTSSLLLPTVKVHATAVTAGRDAAVAAVTTAATGLFVGRCRAKATGSFVGQKSNSCIWVWNICLLLDRFRHSHRERDGQGDRLELSISRSYDTVAETADVPSLSLRCPKCVSTNDKGHAGRPHEGLA